MINKLKELSKEQGISQEYIAREIGVSLQTVSRWFRSKSKPHGFLQNRIEKFIKDNGGKTREG